jgi:hypothetical protein
MPEMTKRRFTDRQLYALRNDIPVDSLMEKVLGVPCSIADGHTRFLCPLCNTFNTAVNPITNLARCFDCRENFNAIDLVMAIRKLDFVNSVRFLLKHCESEPTIPKKDIKCGIRPGIHDDGITHISHVLGALEPSEKDRAPTDRRPSIDKRISTLEQKVNRLSNQVSDLLNAFHIENPSRQ